MTQYESPGMMCQACVRVCSGAWKKGYKAGIVIEASLGKRNGGSPILKKIFSFLFDLFMYRCIQYVCELVFKAVYFYIYFSSR